MNEILKAILVIGIPLVVFLYVFIRGEEKGKMLIFFLIPIIVGLIMDFVVFRS